MLFVLDRYVNGRLMAEGAKVEAGTLKEAIVIAHTLPPADIVDRPEPDRIREATVFKLRPQGC